MHVKILSLALALLGLATLSPAFSTATVRSTRRMVSRGIFMRKRAVDPMKGKSQVVLSKDIEGLGKANAVVTVKNGYYLNYLHPRQMASLATSEMLDKVSADAAAQAEAAAADAAAALGMKEKLEGIKTFTISKKAGEGGTLFGSVTVPEVVALLEEASGLSLGAPKVTMEDVGALGDYSFSVTLHPEATAELTLTVVEES